MSMKKNSFKRQLAVVVCMLLCGLSIQAADDGLITTQIVINKLEAGTLPQRISSDEKNLITNLKINGEINGTDLRFIREIAEGSAYGYEPPKGNLSILDLSGARIISGGDYYYNFFYTKNDELGDCAFFGCNGLTSVTLPSSLTSIGNSAFSFCYDLKILSIPSGITSLRHLMAFSEETIFGDSGLESVYVAWGTPAPAGRFFNGVNISKCTLYVPLGTKQAYWEADVWKDFGYTKEYDVTDVNKIDNHSETKEVSRYSLDGQRLASPTKGINIVRYSDGSIKKEMVE